MKNRISTFISFTLLASKKNRKDNTFHMLFHRMRIWEDGCMPEKSLRSGNIPFLFDQSTLEVARNLLGTVLCRRFEDGKEIRGQIIEVEAYTADDPACHAFNGLTERTKPMFGPPGHAYVYFIYGMYHCLNVVTEPEGTAGAVLVRAVDAEGADGPGKLCRQWAIDKSHNNVDLTSSDSPLWLEMGEKIPDRLVVTTPRIGITRAAERPWRFIVKNHPGLSGRQAARSRKKVSRQR